MTKQERAKKAQAHYEDVKERLAGETQQSILLTTTYEPNSFINRKDRDYHENTFYLKDQDSVSCLFSLPEFTGKTAILNFASYKHPGGYFLGGSPAQEEALCHESNLYPILLAFDDTYYAWNKERLNRALYLDRALYVPDVVFERDGERKLADVITCAAPNFRTAHNYCRVSKAENDRALNSRINFMYQIAENSGVDNLIAGAWGCGVFMQDPSTVVNFLMSNAHKYNIPNIYFAIPDKNSSNFKGFLRVLNERS